MKIAAFFENIMEGAKGAKMTEQEALLVLKKVGLERIFLSDFCFLEREAQLMELFNETSLEVEGVYSFFEFGQNPNDERYKQTIDLAKRVGANNVLLVPGFITKEQIAKKDQRIVNMIAAMKKAVAYANDQGIVVTMEDFDNPDSPIATSDGLLKFLDQVEDLKISFDTGNFITYHEDEMGAFEVLKDHIVSAHLKDRSDKAINENDMVKLCADGTACYPSPVGQGYIPMTALLERFKSIGFNGTYIIELFNYAPEHTLEGIKQSIVWLKNNL